MLDRTATIRRSAIIVFTLLAFFLSILEPLSPTSISENIYKSEKSAFKGIPDAPLDLGSDQKFCRAFYDNHIKMDLEFNINVTKLSKRYTNIFQTDDLNMGFRIEISPDGKLNAFVQSPDGGGPEKVLSVLANEVIKAKTLTKINISVYTKTLTVQLDDGQVASREGYFRPTCNHVLIGGGYDNTRTTIGDVQAIIRIQTKNSVTTFGLPMKTRGMARIVFSLLILGLSWEYRKKIFIFNDKEIG